MQQTIQEALADCQSKTGTDEQRVEYMETIEA